MLLYRPVPFDKKLGRANALGKHAHAADQRRCRQFINQMIVSQGQTLGATSKEEAGLVCRGDLVAVQLASPIRLCLIPDPVPFRQEVADAKPRPTQDREDSSYPSHGPGKGCLDRGLWPWPWQGVEAGGRCSSNGRAMAGWMGRQARFPYSKPPVRWIDGCASLSDVYRTPSRTRIEVALLAR